MPELSFNENSELALAVENVVTIHEPFSAEVGVSNIPLEPNAITVPPVISQVLSKSIAVSPSDVGPLIIIVPPLIYIEPLASRPSPEAFTNILPPLIVSVAVLLLLLPCGIPPVCELFDISLD